MNILANATDVFDEMAQASSFAELSKHPQQITIRTHLVDENNVEICIKDNGKGMEDAVKAQIFEHLLPQRKSARARG